MFFSLILGSPWALHGMGSHAIRAHLRSRNTLFRFCIFLKEYSKWFNFDSILEGFFVENHIEWKKVPNKCSKKGDPPDSNRGLWPWPAAPWQPPSRARFSEQETIVWARNKNRCSFLSPFLSRCPGMGYFWVHLWKIVNVGWNLKQKKTSNCRSFCSLFLFQRSVIWHALGQGPAIFLFVKIIFLL